MAALSGVVAEVGGCVPARVCILFAMEVLPPYRHIPRSKMERAMQAIASTEQVDLSNLQYQVHCTDASEFYHQEARWRCGRYGWRSPLDKWADPGPRQVALDRFPGDPKRQRRYLLKVAYSAAHFDPYLAAGIYKGRGFDIFDPCMGWGDRLAAALALSSTRSFHGCDPNSRTACGYRRQINDWANGRPFLFQGCGIEDAVVPHSSFDIVLTSPPYWNTEHYSMDPGQSHLRYRTYEEWKKGFLACLMRKSVDGLRTGGWLLLMVQDIFTDKFYPLVADTSAIGADFPLDLIGAYEVNHPQRGKIGRPEILLTWRKHGR